jgi:membrane protease YdiL (CAAX protease family)
MATSTLTAPETPVIVGGTWANAPAAIARRVEAGAVGWAGPLLIMVGRTGLCLVAQALAAAVLWVRGSAAPWEAAAAWWTVWGTLADLGCLAGLVWLTRREGLRLGDLIGFERRRLGRDVLVGLGIIAVVFPVAIVGGTMLASLLVFGTTEAPMYAGALTGRALPAWGVAYSLSLWWLIWSPTEELTFNGYVLPRLEALSRSRWLAVALVGLSWAVMHAAIPTLWDARYLAWRTLSFLPLCVSLAALYVRLRRLPPLIVAHWVMDIFGAVFTLAW